MRVRYQSKRQQNTPVPTIITMTRLGLMGEFSYSGANFTDKADVKK